MTDETSDADQLAAWITNHRPDAIDGASSDVSPVAVAIRIMETSQIGRGREAALLENIEATRAELAEVTRQRDQARAELAEARATAATATEVAKGNLSHVAWLTGEYERHEAELADLHGAARASYDLRLEYAAERDKARAEMARMRTRHAAAERDGLAQLARLSEQRGEAIVEATKANARAEHAERQRDEARAAVRRVHDAIKGGAVTAGAIALALCSKGEGNSPSMLDELEALRAENVELRAMPVTDDGSASDA